MNILLVYPESPVTFWSFKHALNFIGKKANVPPLGILTVAAMLPDEWNLKLVDMNVRRLKDRDISWADYVFISAMNIQKQSTREVVDRCKNLGVKTVGGGPLFVGDFEEFDDVDHLLLHEGEVCIPKFLEDLKAGTPKHKYDWERFPSLTETPIPRWDLAEPKKYAMLSLQYSRGCPFNCEFCNVVSLFGHSPRTKTCDQIIAELDSIYKLGWRGGIFFVDDNFIGNKSKLKNEVLPKIIEWVRERDYPFTFFTEVSINIADDDELLKLMSDAGFNNIFVGIETVDEDSLAECNKMQNKNRDLIGNVKRIQSYGMQVSGGFILGFDNDKPSTFSGMVSFIQSSGIVTAMVGVLTALKGTKLFDRMDKEGRLLGGASSESNMDINFAPKMPLKDLMDGYKRVVQSIYSPKNYYKRVKLFLKNYQPNKLGTEKISASYIFAFFKACFRLGIASRGRWQYWKLLGWSLLRKPQAFVMAVTLSVYGYHFRKMAKTAINVRN